MPVVMLRFVSSLSTYAWVGIWWQILVGDHKPLLATEAVFPIIPGTETINKHRYLGSELISLVSQLQIFVKIIKNTFLLQLYWHGSKTMSSCVTL